MGLLRCVGKAQMIADDRRAVCPAAEASRPAYRELPAACLLQCGQPPMPSHILPSSPHRRAPARQFRRAIQPGCGMDFLLVLAVGLVAGTVGGVVGTGSSIILMPVLVVAYGPLEAVPVMAIAAFMGNLGRVIAWRSLIDWRAAGAYCLTAV